MLQKYEDRAQCETNVAYSPRAGAAILGNGPRQISILEAVQQSQNDILQRLDAYRARLTVLRDACFGSQPTPGSNCAVDKGPTTHVATIERNFAQINMMLNDINDLIASLQSLG